MKVETGGDVPSPPDPPSFFWLAITAASVLLILPALYLAHFDFSVFVVAGDHFVGHTAPPIVVRPHSFGYDGQFYYGMALDPFAPAAQASGITFDHPAWRWQRIFYPLVSFTLAFGQARLLPMAMLAVNLICVALLARGAARRSGGGLAAWIFMLWPGFLTCLTHDTTELLACTCLLGAMLAWLDDRLVIFAILAVCATLTRETSCLALGGMVLSGLVLRGPSWRSRSLAACVALVPVVLWHFWLAQLWHGAAEAAPVQANIGMPFVGVAQRFAESLIGAAGLNGKARLIALYTAYCVAGITAFSVWVAARLPAAMRRGGAEAAIGVGWACMLALICTLSARGPWVDPTAIFRAFSECWVAGWLILLLSGAKPGWPAALIVAPAAAMNFQICLIQLR